MLSLNVVGATASVRGAPGAAEHAIAVKPIERLIAHMGAAGRRMMDARGRTRVGVVGGGAGGVELMSATRVGEEKSRELLLQVRWRVL